MSGKLMAHEIAEQPQVIAAGLEQGQGRVEKIAAALRARWADISFVMIAARGTSDNAARYAQYLFGAVNQLPVALATPSLFTLYGTAPTLRHSLTIGISQSGASPDIVAVVSAARQQGAPTLAITNDPDSPLAKAAEFVLPIYAGAERSVAATKTYTAELLALAMLATALSTANINQRWAELQALPDAMTNAVALADQIADQAVRYRYLTHLVASGRGYCYGTAFELALKLKETCYLLAEPYSPPDFLHGPVAIIEESFPALLVAPSGATLPGMRDFAHALRDRGAELLIISDQEDLLALADTPFRLPAGTPEWLAPLVAIIPGQLFALSLARVKGYNPDQPRGLTKVTLTN